MGISPYLADRQVINWTGTKEKTGTGGFLPHMNKKAKEFSIHSFLRDFKKLQGP